MNLPNKITLFRVILIPILIGIGIATLYVEELSTPLWAELGYFSLGNLIMLIIFVIGVFSDFLDGYLARKMNLVTNFGKFADPLADKLLVLALMVVLVEQKSLLEGWVVTIILAREFIVTGFRVVAASRNIVIAAGWLGKIKTNLQFAMVILLLVIGPHTPIYYGGLNFFEILTMVVVYATAIMTIVSGAEYIIKNIGVLKEGD
ncbi:MAG: CDP-diacylglycerol--glycerol-3-phosphate 3-phosphatidyltransferase [Bacilli bacterium]|nr:CDP-diacylglycerol--glycerol-3-phosphate 3-phosphatidyltransferase [Bacilli bacterium]